MGRPLVSNLLAAGVPRALILILALLAYNRSVAPHVGDIDSAEIFAGVMAIVERVQSMGMTSRGYDIGFHEDLDLTTCAGFLLALILVRRVRPGGLCVFAPVCSSFAFLNQGTSGRHGILLPEGPPNVPSVLVGNLLAVRTLLLYRLCCAMGIVSLIEQPQHHSSGMAALRRFKEVIRDCAVYRVPICMGWFGTETTKPTFLFANHKRFAALQAYRPCASGSTASVSKPKKTLVKKKVVDGKIRLTGKRHELKSTQTYSEDFAKAVVECWLAGCPSTSQEPCVSCAKMVTPMFDDGSCFYDEEENIRMLFSKPMDWNDDALLYDVASYLAKCSTLELPKAWPKDWM
ncbi:unnamed protein product [Durusdinium trenchii]|uniref:Uncharacterized protein n=1 Tax=Durusdinium trenchii TaxID=1381693 RepID=A0ABP0N5V3_9DINO